MNFWSLYLWTFLCFKCSLNVSKVHIRNFKLSTRLTDWPTNCLKKRKKNIFSCQHLADFINLLVLCSQFYALKSNCTSNMRPQMMPLSSLNLLFFPHKFYLQLQWSEESYKSEWGEFYIVSIEFLIFVWNESNPSPLPQCHHPVAKHLPQGGPSLESKRALSFEARDIRATRASDQSFTGRKGLTRCSGNVSRCGSEGTLPFISCLGSFS